MKKFILSIIVLLFCVVMCHSQSKYVSPTGSDTNIGTTYDPFKTIVKGLSKVGIHDTLFIRKGIYEECVNYLSFGLGDKDVIIRNGKSTINIIVMSGDFKISATRPVSNDSIKLAITTQLNPNPSVGIVFPDSCYFVPRTYYNTKVFTWSTKKDCPVGKIGSRVYYTVEAGRYSSEVSQAEAQAQAQADLLRNRQQWANQEGVCK